MHRATHGSPCTMHHATHHALRARQGRCATLYFFPLYAADRHAAAPFCAPKRLMLQTVWLAQTVCSKTEAHDSGNAASVPT